MPAKRLLRPLPDIGSRTLIPKGPELPTVLLRLDKDGHLLWLSGSLFDKSVEELVGLKLAAIFRGPSKDVISEALTPGSHQQTQRLSVRNPVTRQRMSIMMRPSSSTDEDIAFFAAVKTSNDVRSAPRKLEKKTESQEPKSRSLVLLADDEPALLNLTARILGMGGYSVLTTDNGHDCLRISRENSDSIGLVILDYSMPGPEISNLIDELAETNPAPALVVSTGHAGDIVRGAIHTAHPWTLLQKPYSNTKLLQLAATLSPLPDD